MGAASTAAPLTPTPSRGGDEGDYMAACFAPNGQRTSTTEPNGNAGHSRPARPTRNQTSTQPSSRTPGIGATCGGIDSTRPEPDTPPGNTRATSSPGWKSASCEDGTRTIS